MRRVSANPPAGRRRGAKATATKRRNVRRRKVFRPSRRTVMAASLAVAIATVAGGAYWSWTSGAVARTASAVQRGIIAFTVDLGLSVQQVYLEGRHETDTETILATLGVKASDPILTIDPEQARLQLENLGWVASARVQRQLPDTLFVRIVERQAAAIWQRGGRFVLVDADGAVIGSQGLERFGHLKVIVGDKAPLRTRDLMDVLASAPAISEHVQAAVWVSGRRWNLRLSNGIDVRLPEEDPAAALERLASLDADHGIIDRDIKAIDLRLPDRLIIRMSEGAKLKTEITASRGGDET